MLLARRGTIEGVEDSFVDTMVKGLDAWTSAAAKDLIRWGFIVLRKEAEVCVRECHCCGCGGGYCFCVFSGPRQEEQCT